MKWAAEGRRIASLAAARWEVSDSVYRAMAVIESSRAAESMRTAISPLCEDC